MPCNYNNQTGIYYTSIKGAYVPSIVLCNNENLSSKIKIKDKELSVKAGVDFQPGPENIQMGVWSCLPPLKLKSRPPTDEEYREWTLRNGNGARKEDLAFGYCDGDCGYGTPTVSQPSGNNANPVGAYGYCDCNIDDIFSCGGGGKIGDCVGKGHVKTYVPCNEWAGNGSVGFCDCVNPYICWGEDCVCPECEVLGATLNEETCDCECLDPYAPDVLTGATGIQYCGCDSSTCKCIPPCTDVRCHECVCENGNCDCVKLPIVDECSARRGNWFLGYEVFPGENGFPPDFDPPDCDCVCAFPVGPSDPCCGPLNPWDGSKCACIPCCDPTSLDCNLSDWEQNEGSCICSCKKGTYEDNTCPEDQQLDPLTCKCVPCPPGQIRRPPGDPDGFAGECYCADDRWVCDQSYKLLGPPTDSGNCAAGFNRAGVLGDYTCSKVILVENCDSCDPASPEDAIDWGSSCFPNC